MKRLFCLRDTARKPYKIKANNSVIYFESKQDTKTYRDDLNAVKSVIWHVAKGPDHKGYSDIKKADYSGAGHKQGQSTGDGYKRRR